MEGSKYIRGVIVLESWCSCCRFTYIMICNMKIGTAKQCIYANSARDRASAFTGIGLGNYRRHQCAHSGVQLITHQKPKTPKSLEIDTCSTSRPQSCKRRSSAGVRASPGCKGVGGLTGCFRVRHATRLSTITILPRLCVPCEL
jgi:hypothetical protein